MKKLQYILLLTVVTISLILSACGGGNSEEIRQPTRQEQLSETGLFGRHPIDGVTTDEEISGQIVGGFFLFAAAMNGSISSTTNYTIQWQPIQGEAIWTTLPRSIFRRVINEGLAQPEIEIVFKDSWKNAAPSHLDMDPNNNFIDVTVDNNNNILYTEGAKLNLNNFIDANQIDIVKIYIASEDLVPPTGVQIP